MKIFHTPVLVEEVVRHLVVRPEGTYIDGTAGTGGHAEAILKSLGPGGRIVGIDRDAEALEIAKRRLEAFASGGKIFFLHGSFEDSGKACDLLGTRQVDGILLDLGVSSLQLDSGERGFGIRQEADLDMRMDRQEGKGAGEIVKRGSVREIEKILKFGEEPFAGRIARAIVKEREIRPIATTGTLASLVERTIPRRAWPTHLHPATRTFQALRIAVNREIPRLENFLKKAPSYLASGGRLVVLSYHSLEDRLMKQAAIRWEKEGIMRRITKKPVAPSAEEIRENPRSRSAKMRVTERVS